ncbi:MAG: hypothetical protein B7Y98_03655 [Sphingomonas sp. 32-62-10]|nr:MAG: hypothetical protein B7Z43_06950 [Sphingomonas sp. 12-62-6]OYX39923.1 MAG: hypothetical protein B7Y98_03655 [Sphingomonas sp. 32-62-10]
MHIDQSFDSRFRPLLSATIASGLVVLAMLDFTASGWNNFAADARVQIAVAARSAYIMFLLNTFALLAAYLAVGIAGPITTACLNFYGAATFLGGTFIVGGLLSIALTLASPGADNPPESVQAYVGMAAFGLVIVITLLVGTAILRFVKAAAPQPKSREESSNDVA